MTMLSLDLLIMRIDLVIFKMDMVIMAPSDNADIGLGNNEARLGNN